MILVWHFRQNVKNKTNYSGKTLDIKLDRENVRVDVCERVFYCGYIAIYLTLRTNIQQKKICF